MKVVHLISGGETGGSRKHLVTLLAKFPKETATLVVFQDGQLANEARESGIDVHVLTQRSRYDLSVLKRLIKFIQEGQYDILHTHGPRANLFASFIIGKLNTVWVTTIHSDPTLDFVKSGLKGFVFTRLNLFAIKKIHHFFAVSSRFKENLMTLGIPANKITTIYNGIEFTEEKASRAFTRQDLDVKDEDFVMAMVARLHPIKGHEIVFEALKKLDNPNIKLLLVGNGPIEAELKKKVTELHLEHQVRFLGFRQDVDEIYAVSDIAMLASYSESFPLALLEAANQHIPLITTDVGGVQNLVTSPDFGWIVPIRDVDAMKDAINEAYHNREGLKEMGDKLYTYASSHFSLDNLYHEVTMAYQHLLNPALTGCKPPTLKL